MESLSKESDIRQLRLRFLDLEVQICSDSRSFMDLFACLYRRFQADGHLSPVQPPIEFAVLTKPRNAWSTPVFILDGAVWPLNSPRLLDEYLHELFLKAIFARIRTHVLIHAGVVSCGGQGIILAADSSHGKTTLVLELVRRGCKFLSDETAALGRADRLVYPFPRGLRIRPGTLELVGFPGLAKFLLDIEEIQPGSIGEAAAISHIVILQGPTGATWDTPDSAREVGILVDRLDEAFLAAVSHITGVTDMCTHVHCGYPLLRLRAIHRTSVVSQIEALCQEHQILVLDVITETGKPPTFDAPARLEALPRSQAIVKLLRRFQGGHKSALLQKELGGGSMRLFMELAALVGRADCHQLLVGPLHEMADLVCGLVGHHTFGCRRTGPSYREVAR